MEPALPEEGGYLGDTSKNRLFVLSVIHWEKDFDWAGLEVQETQLIVGGSCAYEEEGTLNVGSISGEVLSSHWVKGR